MQKLPVILNCEGWSKFTWFLEVLKLQSTYWLWKNKCNQFAGTMRFVKVMMLCTACGCEHADYDIGNPIFHIKFYWMKLSFWKKKTQTLDQVECNILGLLNNNIDFTLDISRAKWWINVASTVWHCGFTKQVELINTQRMV